MSVGTGHERYGDDVGAYLLGALTELETQAFERHMAGCGECRDELERLRVGAEALPRSAEPFAPPPSLKHSLMTVVEAEASARAEAAASARAEAGAPARRERSTRRRFALPGFGPRLAWAAAALVLLGAAIGLGVDRLTSGGSSTRTLTAQVDRAAFPRGSARLDVHGESRPATLRVSGLAALRGGRVYEVWIQRGDRVRPAGALFAVGADGSGVASVPQGVKGVDAVLVTRERAGGSPRPTEAPVIRVET
jgi:anti-sigma-K factor RskA